MTDDRQRRMAELRNQLSTGGDWNKYEGDLPLFDGACTLLAYLDEAEATIAELEAEAADLRAGQANDDRDHRASVATIAEQAMEIERLTAKVGLIEEQTAMVLLLDEIGRLRSYISQTAPSKSEAKRVLTLLEQEIKETTDE